MIAQMAGRIACAIISLIMIGASVPVAAASRSAALLKASSLCKTTKAFSLGATPHLDTFTPTAYQVLGRGRAFPIIHAGEGRPGTLYATFDQRHRILGVYAKYFTWDEVTLKKMSVPITGLPNTDLTRVGTAAGIKIGSPERALLRLQGPVASWLCGTARQTLYINSCNGTRFSSVDGRVVAISSGLGGC